MKAARTHTFSTSSEMSAVGSRGNLKLPSFDLILTICERAVSMEQIINTASTIYHFLMS